MTTVAGFSDGMVVLILAQTDKIIFAHSVKSWITDDQLITMGSYLNGLRWKCKKSELEWMGKISGFDAPAFEANNP